MGKEFVIVNKSRSIASVRRYENKMTKVRLVPFDDNEEEGYLEVGELSDDGIEYYKSLGKIGIHLMEKEDFYRVNPNLLDGEIEVEDEEDGNEDEEDGNEDEGDGEVNTDEEDGNEDEGDGEVNTDEELEEDNEDGTDDSEKDERDGELKEDEGDDVDYTKEELEKMEEEEIRDLAEELGIGNYWNKKVENLIEDILEN